MILRSQLEEIAEDYPGLMRMVALDALEYDDSEMAEYLRQLVQQGVAEVKPHHVAHHRECERIFDEYYAEIESYRRDARAELGKEPHLGEDLKRSMAWFGYEEAARKITDLVGLRP